LRYREWGEQSGAHPSLVLIHGFANSLQTFKRIAPLLEDDYHVVALDMPGFGLSEKPVDHDYGNGSQAQVVSDLITELGLANVVVGGHSMGGALALHVALNSPEVVGMLLFNPGIITTGVPAATEYLFFPLPRIAAKTFGERKFREAFLTTAYLNPDLITEKVIDDLMLGPRSEGYIDGVTVLMSYYVSGDEVNMLAEIDVPTLIVWGAQDRKKPATESAELRDMITGSQLVLIEDAAHYVHEERAAKAARAIIDAQDFWAMPARKSGN
jgi:pimeloyl-ACP methyl ester carboxylesterase